jgi:type I restriction enzyme S subunit
MPLAGLVVMEPEYGSAKRSVPMKSPGDVRYIGIPPGHEFVTAEEVEDKYLLEDGDVLFARSGATAGKTFIFTNDLGPAIFAGYCIRFRFDPKKVAPRYVYFYTKTPRYAAWVRSVQRPAGQPNINKEEFKSFTIPIVAPPLQAALVKDLQTARSARDAKLARAELLLNGIDNFVLAEMGLATPKKDGRFVFAVRLGELKTRCDADYQSPRFRELRNSIETANYPVAFIKDLCQRIESGFAAGRQDQAEDETDGVPHIRPLNVTARGQLTFDGTKYVPRASVARGDLLTKGEVLFNNTNSTAWVGKTTVFPGGRDCACSNHITRLVVDESRVLPEYVAALFNALRGLGLFGLLSTNFNNQAGINATTLGDVRIPVPPLSTQRKVVADVVHPETCCRLAQSASDSRQNERAPATPERLLPFDHAS